MAEIALLEQMHKRLEAVSSELETAEQSLSGLRQERER